MHGNRCVKDKREDVLGSFQVNILVFFRKGEYFRDAQIDHLAENQYLWGKIFDELCRLLKGKLKCIKIEKESKHCPSKVCILELNHNDDIRQMFNF